MPTTTSTTVGQDTTQNITTKMALTTKATTKQSVPLSTSTASDIGSTQKLTTKLESTTKPVETKMTTTTNSTREITTKLAESSSLETSTQLNTTTRAKYALPIIINRNGQVENDFNENFFNSTLFYDTTGVYSSCGVTWRHQHFIFGGSDFNPGGDQSADSQQIAQVVGCSLKRIGKLTKSSLKHGACTVMNDKIYICFNLPEKVANSIECQQCFVSETGPLGPWTKTPDSRQLHCLTHIANSGCKCVYTNSYSN